MDRLTSSVNPGARKMPCVVNTGLENPRMWQRFLGVARDQPDVVAISNENAAWTFAELRQYSEAIATALNQQPDLRIGAALASGPECSAVQLACLATGSAFVPMPETLTELEAEHYLSLWPLDVLICSTVAAATYQATPTGKDLLCYSLQGLLDSRIPSFEPKPSTPADPIAMLQFTSGSTGRPKGVLLGESMLQANLDQSREFLARFARVPVFCPLPQFHAMGGALALEHLLSGSPIHYSNQFNPSADHKRMIDQRCAGLLTSPNHAAMLLKLGVLKSASLPDLRHIVLGTGPVSVSLVADLQEALPEAEVHLRYGLSESVGTLIRLSLSPGQDLLRPGFIGHPLPGVELAEKAGELMAHAASCARFQIDETGQITSLLDDDDFLATGDEVELSEDGVCLGGRRSTFLKVHGYRIDPAEIENLLRASDFVTECVVLGLPDLAAGQRIIACLELPKGTEAPSSQVLQRLCRMGLSSHKIPGRFTVFDELPRTPAGKIDRRAVLRKVEEGG